MTLPLARKTIAVTRPRRQNEELVQLIRAAGGKGIELPLVDIDAALDDVVVQEVAGRLAEYSIAIFVSPNAVESILPRLLIFAAWPDGLLAAVPGPGTGRVLLAHGVTRVILPKDRHDSEGLLATPELQVHSVRGRRIVIFCGEGGRTLLKATLEARGARVDMVPCYRRIAVPGAVARLQQIERLDALILTSSESLRYLNSFAGDILRETTLFVPHARIAEIAQSLGLRHIVRTAADNPGIVADLCAYNWP